jgi:hypothetical protein
VLLDGSQPQHRVHQQKHDERNQGNDHSKTPF